MTIRVRGICNTITFRITFRSRHEIVSYEKVKRKKNQIFSYDASFARKSILKIYNLKYTCTWLIPDWAGINNRQDIILHVKTN